MTASSWGLEPKTGERLGRSGVIGGLELESYTRSAGARSGSDKSSIIARNSCNMARDETKITAIKICANYAKQNVSVLISQKLCSRMMNIELDILGIILPKCFQTVQH